jgi:hypothetical protein
MRQRLAFVAVEKNDVAAFGLAPCSCKPIPPPYWPSGVPSAHAGAAGNRSILQHLVQVNVAPLADSRFGLTSRVICFDVSTIVAVYDELRFSPPTDSGGREKCRLRRGLDHYWLGKTNSLNRAGFAEGSEP